MNKNLVKIVVKEGAVEDHSGDWYGDTIGLSYNSKGEAYLNKEQIQYFNIDEDKQAIEIFFPMVSETLAFRVYLAFPNRGGEFQRIKRELLA
ncbi:MULTISPECIES: hypothetical protein [Vibrio]|uniref:Uncharacterized protein n=1 Tax=Vibrio parahaemolyticus TaxID=670 RepID=A0AAW3IRX6_VIBPH|nr:MULTISPECIES: hypothetical protein [Vibrio]EGQ7665377.1 hypothetical protein [Vibrio parahaemolyticus]EGQ7830812.1 hypothetical protein [Vibrio parahaemolyticus]EGQ9828560.1 hypothetical protein [Vibrio parahaemolyticus]EGR0035660.1 hypothetical protein [Vibrio parahaemolyticus]EGR0204829.1 hypothetical protein [Vibrio parahaemolyticus]